MIGIKKVNKRTGHKVFNLAYMKYILDPEYKTMKDQGVYKTLTDFGVKHYCIYLLFINKGVFEGNTAVVYDDWDVGDINLKKFLPSLCAKLFRYNVFG